MNSLIDLETFLSTPLWILFPNDFTEKSCKMTTAFNKLIMRKATKEDYKLLKNYNKNEYRK